MLVKAIAASLLVAGCSGTVRLARFAPVAAHDGEADQSCVVMAHEERFRWCPSEGFAAREIIARMCRTEHYPEVLCNPTYIGVNVECGIEVGRLVGHVFCPKSQISDNPNVGRACYIVEGDNMVRVMRCLAPDVSSSSSPPSV